MIQTNLEKSLNIILPNTNKALKTVLQESSKSDLQQLTQHKDLNSILNSLLKQSATDSSQDKLLLSLLKNNPTLKNLGNTSSTLKELLHALSLEKPSFTLEKNLTKYIGDIKDISEKNLKNKIENSGLFVENKLKNIGKQTHLKEFFSQDFKLLLHQAEKELSASSSPQKQELLKHIEKLSLQLDYHQLLSHLSNATSLYIPYSWDALENGNITIKNVENEKFFTDINLKLKEYGELRLRLGLFEKNQLNINITIQNEELKSMIKSSLPILKKQLFNAGIIPKSIKFIDEKKSIYETVEFDIAVGFEVKA